MKYFVLAAVQLYCLTIRPFLSRRCIFRESCSAHVLRVARTQGGRAGLIALVSRMRACRPGYYVVVSSQTLETEFHLADGTVVSVDDVSEAVFEHTT